MTTPSPHRRGYTLIEMIVVMSAMAVILGMCVGLIQALLKLDRIGRAHLAEVTARGRLARQFRQDVRAASRAEPVRDRDGRAAALRLDRPDGPSVEYRAGPGRLDRDERPEGDAPARRETFRLRATGAPRFEVRDDGGDAFVGLLVPDWTAFEPAGGPRESRIEALLGRDRRLSGLGGVAR
jgi:prepilin-type N-terminal cleavage/methylation domain-containing protein